MNKSQLVDAIARNAKITKVDAKKALDAFIEVTGETLRSGDKIVLVGFGSFSVAKKPERTGRNPRTGAAYPDRPAECGQIQSRCRIERYAEITGRSERKRAVCGNGLSAFCLRVCLFQKNRQSLQILNEPLHDE